MEFVGNQINFKTVPATLGVAFLIGRVNVFEGTFPAAIALITVMMAVSTLYIYLVPVLLAAVISYSGTCLNCFGDMLTIIFLGVFFLFFHNRKFSIYQRTGIAVAALFVFTMFSYSYLHILYLLDYSVIIKEAVATAVYILVFNTAARVVFTGQMTRSLPEDKISLAFEIILVSIIGTFQYVPVMIAGWIFIIFTAEYYRGFRNGAVMLMLAAVYWRIMGYTESDVFVVLAVGLTAGWFISSLAEGRYRKFVLPACVAVVMASGQTGHLYEVLTACVIFAVIPSSAVVRVWSGLKKIFAPELKNDRDIAVESMKHELVQQKRTFDSLAKMYGSTLNKSQIISYQFEGLSRTVENLIKIMDNPSGNTGKKPLAPFKVGSASYAFENLSGDSSMSFSFGGDSQALVISDGMGKGSAAAAESRLVVTTLSKLLSAGFDVDIAIKTVNAVLMKESSQDMFATLDLAIVNRRSRRAQIFKMGAASTFVRHDGKVLTLKRSALPAGIALGPKMEYIDVRLKKGDLLVMVSDGVTDCDRKDPECKWLVERLAEIGSRDPDTVAELIVNKAAEKYQLRERDDLTVMVAAI